MLNAVRNGSLTYLGRCVIDIVQNDAELPICRLCSSNFILQWSFDNALCQ